MSQSVRSHHVECQAQQKLDQPPNRGNERYVEPPGHDGGRNITDLLDGLEGLHEADGLAQKACEEGKHAQLQDKSLERLDVGGLLTAERSGNDVDPKAKHDQTDDGDGNHERSPGCKCIHDSHDVCYWIERAMSGPA